MLNEKINTLVNKIKELHYNDPTREKYLLQVQDYLCADMEESICFFDTCNDIDTLEWASTFIDDLAYEFPTMGMVNCILRLKYKNTIQENYCSVLIKTDVENAIQSIERIISDV